MNTQGTKTTSFPEADGVPVLVVDDDARIRQAVQWTLEDEGLTVLVAADGRQAEQRAAERTPAVVVLDMGLPDLDGASLAARLRQRCGAELPILLITADGRAREKAGLTGAYAYLSKPFQMDELVRLVRVAVPDGGTGEPLEAR